MKQMRGIEVLVLRDVVGTLGILLHAPRGPFYSPKAARSR
jgi:predicted NUDIX family NTP pyrophosphohydrolase